MWGKKPQTFELVITVGRVDHSYLLWVRLCAGNGPSQRNSVQTYDRLGRLKHSTQVQELEILAQTHIYKLS